MSFSPVNPKIHFSTLEKEILEFWRKDRTFQKSIDQRTEKEFTFYDGPPFATGLPHYGHILAHIIKDVVPRFWTMKGYRVERRFGWDCHGLPIENIKEKDLGISGKKQIEEYGIDKFNEECRAVVLKYAEDWRVAEERMGRWVDMDNDYKTMDTSYMESIWWVFSELWKKDLIYQGKKAMQICPRCTTPLSNFEVSQGYKEITDVSTIVKFPVLDEDFLKKYGNGKRTSFIAWTTTPWSVPTTMGLAIGADFEYIIVSIGNEQIIAAKNRLDYIVGSVGPKSADNETGWEVVRELKGSELEHLHFEHPFQEYLNTFEDVQKSETAFHTYLTDYVSIEDGTGIVTINGAYGEIDMDAAKKFNLPIIVNVNMDGTYQDSMPLGAGEQVKPADDPTKMDQRIAKYLEEKGFLYRKENYRHTYPHCWRCDHPLLNYATSSWFVRVTEIKDRLLANNAKTHWMPETMRDGRFGKWLENARDWAVSRSRYWGAPLPIWKCESCNKVECLGSLEDLFKKVPEKMVKLILVRHGESENNVQGNFVWTQNEGYPLTEKGKEQAGKTALDIGQHIVDAIYSSPILRAKQTAEIIAKVAGKEIIFDDRLKETRRGELEGPGHAEEWTRLWNEVYEKTNLSERMDFSFHPTSETYRDLMKRGVDFLNSILQENKGKTVVLSAHASFNRMLRGHIHSFSETKMMGLPPIENAFAEIIYLDPETGREFDLHKHIVDKLTWKCECGGNMQRVPEVLDCWFESGSMPYAQLHYPFENKQKFEENFPANFIAEGQDQTRGWFYTLMVLSTALFDEPAFHNVIVNGIVLAEDGRKMSKKLKNYPDPAIVMEQYGADAMRWYLMSSPAVAANDLRFSEKGVDEVVKSILLPFWHAYSFFITYANIDNFDPTTNIQPSTTFSNPLDKWILSELQICIKDVTEALEDYNLAAATKPILDFLDGLTNWYIRRSRRRFWKSENDGDKFEAYSTLHEVLSKLSQLMSPFIPFITEEIYRNLNSHTPSEKSLPRTGSGGSTDRTVGGFEHNAASVHLTDWPTVNPELIHRQLNIEIGVVRHVISLGLSLRAKHQIKVRQPLSKAQLVVHEDQKEIVLRYQDIILEELNIKELEFITDASEVAQTIIKVNAKIAGPRLGKDVQAVIMAGKEGKFRIVPNTPFEKGSTDRTAGGFEHKDNGQQIIITANNQEYILGSDEVEVVFIGKPGHEVASEKGFVLSLDTIITPELEAEGVARELVRTIQDMRKEAGYDVSDKIQIQLTGIDEKVLEAWSDYIQKETLGTFTNEEKPWDLSKELEYCKINIVKI